MALQIKVWDASLVTIDNRPHWCAAVETDKGHLVKVSTDVHGGQYLTKEGFPTEEDARAWAIRMRNHVTALLKGE